MKYKYKKSGFSLTEVLLAIGVLTIGMIFIAGVFPVAIHFTTIATERTIAAVVADEAFAKIKLYSVDFDSSNWPAEPNECVDFNDVLDPNINFDTDEFAYPSDPNIDISKKQYFWSALCRLTEEYDATSNPNPLVQVTVFVSRRTSPSLDYPNTSNNYPTPIQIDVTGSAGDKELDIDPNSKNFINDGYTIVDNKAGRIYRVLERYADPNDDTILLDKAWDSKSDSPVWVVPPPVNGGRYPCIAVYQKLIRF